MYIQYNWKIATRFQKKREKGRDFNPLILEDFKWDNEWVNGDVIDPAEEELWEAVDEVLEASTNLESRRSRRRATTASSSQVDGSSDIEMIEDCIPIILNNDESVDDDYGYSSPNNNSVRNDEARAQDNILDLYDDFWNLIVLIMLFEICPSALFSADWLSVGYLVANFLLFPLPGFNSLLTLLC